MGLINNTHITPVQFVKAMCHEFQLKVKSCNKTDCLQRFNDFLLDQFANRQRVVLIVDEAQNLPSKTLEEIRMLSNLEAEKARLIQIILVGQPQLNSILQHPDLEQFAQRVSVFSHLRNLERSEITGYIHHRLEAGGALEPNIFTPEAIEKVYDYSGGNPRIINIICHNTLLFGFIDSVKVLDESIVEKVIQNREGSELFLKNKTQDKRPAESSSLSSSISRSILKQLQSIESRLGSMECSLGILEGRLETIAGNIEQ